MQPTGSSPRILSHIKEIVFVTVLVLAVSAIALVTTFWPKAVAGSVRVSLHGQEVTVLRLDVPTTYELYSAHGIVKIEVKDHKAAIVSSPCPNQHCVHEGFKGEEGSSIVCVPEEVCLTFLGNGEVSEIVV